MPFDPGFNFNPSAEERMRKPLSMKDSLAIAAECPSGVMNIMLVSVTERTREIGMSSN